MWANRISGVELEEYLLKYLRIIWRQRLALPPYWGSSSFVKGGKMNDFICILFIDAC